MGQKMPPFRSPGTPAPEAAVGCEPQFCTPLRLPLSSRRQVTGAKFWPSWGHIFWTGRRFFYLGKAAAGLRLPIVPKEGGYLEFVGSCRSPRVGNVRSIGRERPTGRFSAGSPAPVFPSDASQEDAT
jgi:hypothetical protein